MSRNLSMTDCRTCGSEVQVTGLPYVKEWATTRVVVCDAECTVCHTKYTAWLNGTGGGHHHDREKPFYDLSYRSTFNDEPGEEDLPKGKIEVLKVVRIDGVTISETSF